MSQISGNTTFWERTQTVSYVCQAPDLHTTQALPVPTDWPIKGTFSSLSFGPTESPKPYREGLTSCSRHMRCVCVCKTSPFLPTKIREQQAPARQPRPKALVWCYCVPSARFAEPLLCARPRAKLEGGNGGQSPWDLHSPSCRSLWGMGNLLCPLALPPRGSPRPSAPAASSRSPAGCPAEGVTVTQPALHIGPALAPR